jgi:hypothetical protein
MCQNMRSAAPRDERWQQRYDNLPRQVDSIQEKIAREQAAAFPPFLSPSQGCWGCRCWSWGSSGRAS